MDWNAVVDKLGPCLLRYFMGSFPRHLAEELVQETIIRLVRKVESRQFQAAKGGLTQFAYGIARFVRLETLKSLPIEILTDEVLPTAADSAEEALEQKRQARKLRIALNQLPEIQREVLLLTLDEELSLSQVAAILDIPLGTIKSHVHRAKALLFEILKEKELTHERERT